MVKHKKITFTFDDKTDKEKKQCRLALIEIKRYAFTENRETYIRNMKKHSYAKFDSKDSDPENNTHEAVSIKPKKNEVKMAAGLCLIDRLEQV